MAHHGAVIIILEATGSHGRVLIGKWHDHIYRSNDCGQYVLEEFNRYENSKGTH